MTSRTSMLVSIFFGLLLLAGSCAHAQTQSLDTDGDGIPDQFDADDDGDGLLDPLDSNPTDSEVLERIVVDPWINELKVELHVETGRIDLLAVEIAKLSSTVCNQISVHTYDENGLAVGNYERIDGLDEHGGDSNIIVDGLYASEVVEWYRGETGCDGVWLVNDYDFVNVQFRDAKTREGRESTNIVDLDAVAGIYLNVAGKCVEVISFGDNVSPANNICDNAIFSDLPGVLNKSAERFNEDNNPVSTWARAGIGVRGGDFSVWYEDDRYWTVSSGWTPHRNNFQYLTWSAPESEPIEGALEVGVLEIPRPRNSVVKSLMDSGWAYPPSNGDTLKVFQPLEIKDEHLSDDGVSTYVFASKEIRPDYLDFLKFYLGRYIAFMGGVRAENYMHHFDYPASSQILNDIAFRRGNYDARNCFNGERENTFFSVGSGGGYWGAAEEGYRNDGLEFCYLEGEGEDNAKYRFGKPTLNFDASYGGVGFDWPDNILTVGSPIDLGAQSEPKYGGTRPGKFRDELVAGHMHEWSHNWESFHVIAYSELGPKRFSHPVQGWADSPLMHGTSIPFEIYVREYILHDQDYDGTGKLWSMKKFDERDYLNSEFDPTGILEKFRAGDQGVELYWANYLVTNFGLEKLYSEYYRRRASTGDFRIALHQTYGKPYDELLQDAAAWISTVTTHEEYRLLFADAEEFAANLNQSFNVSFLQVRNSSTPNNRFQTIYAFVGEGEPAGIGDQWIPVTHGDDVQVVMGENTTSNLSSSATGQLVVNGHKAYYYSQDTSVHHAGGLAASKDWSAFTRRGELTSNLWFPVFIYDHDGDGLPDDYDPDYQDLFFTRDGRYKEDDWPGFAEYSGYGQVVSVLKPSGDNDGDGVINGEDAFPMDAFETIDTDGDGIGNNADLDDDEDGFTDEEELADGTDPLSRFSCRSGCFSFDVDESLQAQPLTDGLLVIRHLFGFSGDALTSGAVASDANRDASEVIASYLTDADSQLDIDGDGESKPLTDGLLLIRYLFGFSGDSLISGAIGAGAERDTAEEVEAYIKERVPAE